MKTSEILFGVLRIPLDAIAVFGALLLSYSLRLAQIDLIPRLQLLEPAQTLPAPSVYMTDFVIPGIGLFIVIAAALHLYALRVTGSAWRETGRIVTGTLVWIVLVTVWYFLIRRELFYSRILLVHSAFFIALFVILLRSVLICIQRAFLRIGYGVRTVLSVGAVPLPLHARSVLTADIRYAYCGHCDNLDAVQSARSNRGIDLIVQTDPHPTSRGTCALVDFCRNSHIGYAFLPPVFADAPHQLRIERLGLLPILHFQPTPLDGWGRVWKRVVDILAGIVLLAALSPLLIVITLSILLDSGWPVLYVSMRVGEHGKKTIPILKFRTMVAGADRMKHALRGQSHRRDGPLFKVHNDPRVTSMGKLLRLWSLDELPQLWNVLWGQMSLVGPRPHLPEEVERYAPQERRVFAVKPGMTGLAQIMGRSDLKFEDEVRFDLRYIEEWSPLLDVWIIWRTAFVVLWRRGAD